MDRLSFLTRISQQHPDDSEAIYWIAQEYASLGQLVEAIGQFSAGLAICKDEKLRLALLEGLTSMTILLQQGNASPNTQQPAAKKEELEDEYEDQDENEYEDEDEDQDEDAQDDREDSVNIGSTRTLVQTAIGLHVLDGGKAPEVAHMTPTVERTTFADVAGLTELKKTIRLRIISPFQNKDLFSKFRKKTGGGVLLYGPPGCGKTFITKATAGECNATFLPIYITDILDKYIGESERKLKDMFEKARHQKPSIMFFDEIDTIGLNRSISSPSMRGVIDTFLTEMEGVDTNTDQVLIIGATNMPWDVDDALKRPGRFDRLVFVAPPDEEARNNMFQLKLAGRYIDSIDTKTLAAKTSFFSGADIENLCERVAEHVLGEILETGVERPMRMSDFELLLTEVRPSTMEWLRKVKNYVKYANQSGIYNEVEDYLKRYGRHI